MLSIGTGCVEEVTDTARVNTRDTLRPRMLSNWRHLFRILTNNMEMALNCDRIWHEYYQFSASSISGPSKRLFRINPTIPGTLPALDDISRMAELQTHVQAYLATDTKAMEVARQLAASSFYFDLSSVEDIEEDFLRCKIQGK